MSTALHVHCQRALAELGNLSNTELHKIVESDDRIEEILGKLNDAYLVDVIEQKRLVSNENADLAKHNLRQEPLLIDGREKLESLNEQVNSLRERVDQKTKELRTKTGEVSLETTLALLQTAASEAEEESEKFAKSFLANELDMDAFVEQFLEKRKTVHMRLVKAEKLTKIITGQIGNYANSTPPMSINSNYFPGMPSAVGIAPYPTQPPAMPLPPTANYFQYHY